MVKQGWVEKRSNFLKQWRKRWLVLTPLSLSSYKSENLCEKPTEHLQLSAISNISVDPDSSKPNTFRIETKNQVFRIAASTPDSMTDWVQTIQYTLDRSRFSINSRDADPQKHQQAFLSSSLHPLQALLSARESELQLALTATQEALRVKAEHEMAYATSVHDSIQKVFTVFQAVYENCELHSQEKLRKLREIAKGIAAVAEDSVGESAIHAYVNLHLASALLSQNVKITVSNPNERHLRRTDITRALKWRYNGLRIDALSFSVSKSVQLTAVGFCSPHKPSHHTSLLTLKIVVGDSIPAAQGAVYTHPKNEVLTYKEEESVEKIVLASKVALTAGVTYTLLGQLEGASTYKCVLCRRSVGGEVSWTFSTTKFTNSEDSNRTDLECGPIADFYYLSLD